MQTKKQPNKKTTKQKTLNSCILNSSLISPADHVLMSFRQHTLKKSNVLYLKLHLKIAVRAQLMYSQTHVSTEPLEMLPLL